MSAENDNKPLEEVKAPEVQAEGTAEVCDVESGGHRVMVRTRARVPGSPRFVAWWI